MDASAILATLTSHRRPVLIPHRHPDGDAIGSALGLYHYLKEAGAAPVVVSPTDIPRTLAWLPGVSEIIVYTDTPDAAARAVQQADLIVFIDFGEIKRLDELGELIGAHAAPRMLIDHHPHPKVTTQWQWWDPSAPATAYLIARLLWEAPAGLTPTVAECLLTGIVTDTGRFNYSTSAALFEVVGKLIEKGADLEKIIERVFYRFREAQLRFWGEALSRKMTLFRDYHTALMVVSRAELEAQGLQEEDLEGLVNFPLQMEDVFISVLIRETAREVKLSFRSRGPYPVNRFAGEYFGGGGHFHAAGARSFQPLAEVVAFFEASLPRFWQSLSENTP